MTNSVATELSRLLDQAWQCVHEAMAGTQPTKGLLIASLKTAQRTKVTFILTSLITRRPFELFLIDIDWSKPTDKMVTGEKLSEEASVWSRLEISARMHEIDFEILVHNMMLNRHGWRFMGFHDNSCRYTGQDNAVPWNPHLWELLDELINTPIVTKQLRRLLPSSFTIEDCDLVVNTLSGHCREGVIVLER